MDRDFLLLVRTDHADGSVRAALSFAPAELVELLARARAAGAPLAILCSPGHLALLSTESAHARAFAPLMRVLRERSVRSTGLGGVRVRRLIGSEVAHWIVRQSCGLDSPGTNDFLSSLHGAAALSARHGALSSALGELIQLGERARARIVGETRFAQASAGAEIELERLAAERIAEEEVVDWQSSAPSRRASALGHYGHEEAQSSVRLRVTRVLDRLEKPKKLGVA